MPAPDHEKLTRRPPDAMAGNYAASVAGELAAMRRCIAEQLITSDAAIDDMLAYVGARTGKMLRPAMLLLVGQSCADLTETHVRAAAIIELLHVATLLHDDVIDEAQSRRSAATANKLWGNASAVLLGDFVLSKVFFMSTTLDSRLVGQLLSQTAVDVCRGELRQNVESHNWELSEAAYYDIVCDKTAALFGAACYLGSLITGGPEARHESFRNFGLKIGMAFQITDDLLDIVGDEARVGKTLGTDLAGRKMTLPLIHLLASADAAQRQAFIARLSAPGGGDPQTFSGMLRQADSITYTQSVARRFCREAATILTGLETPRTTAPLAAIADSMAERCT